MSRTPEIRRLGTSWAIFGPGGRLIASGFPSPDDAAAWLELSKQQFPKGKL